LTTTWGDFANGIHKDRDKSPYAFGMWWISEIEKSTGDLVPHMNVDAQCHVKGGEFIIPEFNIGVDFQR
jgi:hypothetical protein